MISRRPLRANEYIRAIPPIRYSVYVIWFNILASDNKGAWDEALMTDPRVQHYWDEGREIGTWYADNDFFSHGSIAWDIYYLYGRNAVWESEPEPLLRSGYTVFGNRTNLLNEAKDLASE